MPANHLHPRRGHFAATADPVLLVHGSHHKMGTVYIHTVLRELCHRHGLVLLNGVQADLDDSVDLFFQNQSRIDVEALAPFRGSHVMRDLRDVVISGYSYHRWTREEWAHRPMRPRQIERLECADIVEPDESYQELLNRVDDETGIAIELRRVGRGVGAALRRWDFADERFLELRFEELVTEPAAVFERLLTWYGLAPELVDDGTAIAVRRSLDSIKQRPVEERPPHARGGGSKGSWQERFTDAHKAELKALAGDVLVASGYAADDSW